MTKIIILPEYFDKKTNNNLFKYSLMYNPDYIFQVSINDGLRALNGVENICCCEKNDVSWLFKSLNFLSDKVNFVEDELIFLSEKIYTNQLKVWFANYSIPLSGMSKHQISQTLNKILIFAA